MWPVPEQRGLTEPISMQSGSTTAQIQTLDGRALGLQIGECLLAILLYHNAIPVWLRRHPCAFGARSCLDTVIDFLILLMTS